MKNLFKDYWFIIIMWTLCILQIISYYKEWNYSALFEVFIQIILLVIIVTYINLDKVQNKIIHLQKERIDYYEKEITEILKDNLK